MKDRKVLNSESRFYRSYAYRCWPGPIEQEGVQPTVFKFPSQPRQSDEIDSDDDNVRCESPSGLRSQTSQQHSMPIHSCAASCEKPSWPISTAATTIPIHDCHSPLVPLSIATGPRGPRAALHTASSRCTAPSIAVSSTVVSKKSVILISFASSAAAASKSAQVRHATVPTPRSAKRLAS